MKRVILIHWKAEEAQPRIERLRRAGVTAEWIAPAGGAGLHVFREHPPDAFIIDLSRLPSQGRDIAIWLRRQKLTRAVPLVFAGGEAEKVARVRSVLPDAAYAEWDEMPAALLKAIREAPAHPLAPVTFAAYSGTPLVKKLGIRAGSGVALLGAPDGFEAKLEALPDGVRLTRRARNADRILLFVQSVKELGQRFQAAERGLKDGGALWVVWPKKASGTTTDLTQVVVRRFGLDAGWVDYKICAVDETWSGLLFRRRPQP